jgi:DEAD/DEAH box helicase domain-containing protein
MARDILYFDLETQRTANDVGGWGNKHKMGMSIGVTYSTTTGEYHIYSEKTVEALIAQLTTACSVATTPSISRWNCAASTS